MSSQPGEQPEELTPEQEEMLRQMEEQMRELRVEDLLLQSVANLLNLSARRIAKEDERDLAQAKIGIDAVSALVGLLPEQAAAEVESALSQVRMLFAQTAGGGEGEAPSESGPDATAEQPQSPPQRGPEPPPRLWTPGS